MSEETLMDNLTNGRMMIDVRLPKQWNGGNLAFRLCVFVIPTSRLIHNIHFIFNTFKIRWQGLGKITASGFEEKKKNL